MTSIICTKIKFSDKTDAPILSWFSDSFLQYFMRNIQLSASTSTFINSGIVLQITSTLYVSIQAFCSFSAHAGEFKILAKFTFKFSFDGNWEWTCRNWVLRILASGDSGKIPEFLKTRNLSDTGWKDFLTFVLFNSWNAIKRCLHFEIVRAFYAFLHFEII